MSLQLSFLLDRKEVHYGSGDMTYHYATFTKRELLESPTKLLTAIIKFGQLELYMWSTCIYTLKEDDILKFGPPEL